MNSLQFANHQRDKGNFLEAIAAYESAARHNSSTIPACFEGKALTYYKMGELDKALEQAKEMIRRAPTSVKAYLLTGSLVERMRTTQEGILQALELYKRGLARVDPKNKQCSKLQSAHDRLLKVSQLPKRADPVAKLPNELIEMIFEQLDMTTKVRCLRVCKCWKSYLEDSARLWSTLDLGICLGRISRKALNVFMKRSKYTIDKVILPVDVNSMERTLKDLFSKCRGIESLAVAGPQYLPVEIGASLINSFPLALNLKRLKVDCSCVISLHTMFSILEICPNLSHVQLEAVHADRPETVAPTTAAMVPMPHLSELVIIKSIFSRKREYLPWTLLRLDDLITATPNLKVGRFEGWDDHTSANMPNFSLWTQLEHLSLRNTCTARLAPLPQTLQCLDLTSCPDKPLNSFMFSDLESTNVRPRVVDCETALHHPDRCSLPKLEELHARSCNSLSPELLEFLTRAAIAIGNLKLLAIGGRALVQNPVTHPYPFSKSVVSLSLGDYHRIDTEFDEKSYWNIIKRYPNIQELNFANAEPTGRLLKHIIKKFGPLRRINLTGCSIRDADTIAYLESKGTSV